LARGKKQVGPASYELQVITFSFRGQVKKETVFINPGSRHVSPCENCGRQSGTGIGQKVKQSHNTPMEAQRRQDV
jgi:hypothetical protein